MALLLLKRAFITTYTSPRFDVCLVMYIMYVPLLPCLTHSKQTLFQCKRDFFDLRSISLYQKSMPIDI